MADGHFDRFMGDSDGIMWTIERDPNLRSTITAILLLDGTPDWERLRERVDRTTHLIPRLRQRVVEPPLRLAPPRWVTDGRFDLDYHLRRIVAPEPADLDRVLRLAESLSARAFDPERPLWEALLCEGLDDGRAAYIIKLHHSVTDGIGGMRLLSFLVDLEREPAARPPDAPIPAAEHLSTTGLTVDAAAYTGRKLVAGALDVAASAARVALATVVDPLGTARRAAEMTRSIGHVLAPITTTLSPVMRERSLRRHFAAFELPLEAMKRAAHSTGGTLNDAFVAAAAGGLHRYHVRHGEPVPELRVTMPISTRNVDDPLGGNRFMPARFTIPVAIGDPAERVRRVGEVCRAWTNEPALPVTDALATVLDHLPGRVTTLVFGSMLERIDCLVTNVPGSPVPLYLVGTAVENLWAMAPTMGAAANLALLSYVDRCELGIVADTAAVPDPDVLVECLRESFDEILALGSRAPTPVVPAGPEAGR